MWMSSNVILGDRFGPEILTMLEIKYKFCMCAHLKVQGWLSEKFTPN